MAYAKQKGLTSEYTKTDSLYFGAKKIKLQKVWGFATFTEPEETG